MIPVSDGCAQDSITKKIYDYRNGYTLDGVKVPGGSVANQTPNFDQYAGATRMFDNRQEATRRRAGWISKLKKVAIKDDPYTSSQYSTEMSDPGSPFIPPTKSTSQEGPGPEESYEVKEMMDWLNEHFENVSDLSKDEVYDAIEKNYDGGVEEFKAYSA